MLRKTEQVEILVVPTKACREMHPRPAKPACRGLALGVKDLVWG